MRKGEYSRTRKAHQRTGKHCYPKRFLVSAGIFRYLCREWLREHISEEPCGEEGHEETGQAELQFRFHHELAGNKVVGKLVQDNNNHGDEYLGSDDLWQHAGSLRHNECDTIECRTNAEDEVLRIMEEERVPCSI